MKSRPVFKDRFYRLGVHAWGAAIGAVGSIAGGALASSGQGSAARGDYKKQKETLGLEKRVWDDYRKKGETLWGDYRTKYAPIENQYLATTRAGIRPDYSGFTNEGGLAAQEVAHQFELARGATSRDMERRGISSTSPDAMAMRMSSRLGEAAQTAGAYTKGSIDMGIKRANERKYVENTNYARRMAASGTGRGIQGAGLETERQVAGGYGGMADSYALAGQQHQALAGAYAGAAGAAASGLFQFGSRYLQPDSQPAAPIIERGTYSSAPGG